MTTSWKSLRHSGAAEAPLTPNVVNRDNEWLEPINGVIGHVSEVNGAGAQEMPEFVTIRHELSVMVKQRCARRKVLTACVFVRREVHGDHVNLAALRLRGDDVAETEYRLLPGSLSTKKDVIDILLNS